MQNDYEKIRQRAYEIWDREGRQEGRAEEHWQQAERELAASQADAPSDTTNEAGLPALPIKAEAGVAAQAKRPGNGASKPTPTGAPPTARRKRRGAQQPLSQT
jgi:hypothetical protein